MYTYILEDLKNENRCRVCHFYNREDMTSGTGGGYDPRPIERQNNQDQ